MSIWFWSIGGLVSGKTCNSCLFYRVGIFMMVVVSWTFSSQSRLYNILAILFWFVSLLRLALRMSINTCIWVYLYFLFLVFADLCVLICFSFSISISLDELQVNYNNERSRWNSSSLGSEFAFFHLLDAIFLVMLNVVYMIFSLFRDFTNPNLPAEQKGGRSSQVCYATFGSLFFFSFL